MSSPPPKMQAWPGASGLRPPRGPPSVFGTGGSDGVDEQEMNPEPGAVPGLVGVRDGDLGHADQPGVGETAVGPLDGLGGDAQGLGNGLLGGPAGAAVEPAELEELDEDEVIGAGDGPLLDEFEGPLGDGVEGVTDRVSDGWQGVGESGWRRSWDPPPGRWPARGGTANGSGLVGRLGPCRVVGSPV